MMNNTPLTIVGIGGIVKNRISPKMLLFLSFILLSLTGSAQSSSALEIEKVSSQIESIRVKVDWAKNTPEENAIALAEGWYEEMDKKLRFLTDKKRNLLMTETGKRWVSIEEINEMDNEKRQLLLLDSNYIIEQ